MWQASTALLAQTLALTGQLANASETITLEIQHSRASPPAIS
jgi:hypothetical protein